MLLILLVTDTFRETKLNKSEKYGIFTKTLFSSFETVFDIAKHDYFIL